MYNFDVSVPPSAPQFWKPKHLSQRHQSRPYFTPTDSSSFPDPLHPSYLPGVHRKEESTVHLVTSSLFDTVLRTPVPSCSPSSRPVSGFDPPGFRYSPTTRSSDPSLLGSSTSTPLHPLHPWRSEHQSPSVKSRLVIRTRGPLTLSVQSRDDSRSTNVTSP